MKIALVWSTPITTDPNLYLRSEIENSFLGMIDFESFDSVKGIEISQVFEFDAVLLCGTLLTFEPHIEQLLRIRSGIPLFFWNFEDPYDHDRTTFWKDKFEHTFTTEFNALPFYTKGRVSYLPLAARPREISISNLNVREQLSLVGSDYPRRHEIFEYLAEKKPTNIELIRVGDVGIKSSKAKYLGRLTNERVHQVDRESRSTLLIGRDFDFCNNLFSVPAGSPGPRFFEALVSGVNILYDPYTVDFSGNPDLKSFATPFYRRDEIWGIVKDQITNDSLERKENQIKFAHSSQTYKCRAESLLNTIGSRL